MKTKKTPDKYLRTKQYWKSQADRYSTEAIATTNDFYLREIEIRCLFESINANKDRIRTIADIGCGNGYSTVHLAKLFPKMKFVGYDYVNEMIAAATLLKEKEGLKNISFESFDLIHDNISQSFDMIITDRCLINLPSWMEQKKSIKKIYNLLNSKGVYLMIENFVGGHDNFNTVRKQYGLHKIEVREHNLFFEKKKLQNFISSLFEVKDYKNISSLYYLVSRVIYSRICTENGVDPDYMDIHHQLASMLPFAGEYGPVAMFQLIKR